MDKYSVFSYNLGGYEIMHPVHNPSPNCHYVYVTDDKSIVSDGVWDVKYVDDLTGNTWDKCYQLRFDPFKYCDTEIVLRIDGSIKIEDGAKIDKLIERFIKEGADMSLMIHPGRNTMYDEYVAWVQMRGYELEQANRILSFMYHEGYDVRNYKHLMQACFEICKRSSSIVDCWHRLSYDFCKLLAPPYESAERVDQTISSFLLAKFFQHAKIMYVDQRMVQNDFLKWCAHGTDEAFPPVKPKNMIDQYVFNKRFHEAVRPQDL